MKFLQTAANEYHFFTAFENQHSVICKACIDFPMKSFEGGNAEFTSTLFTGAAIILTVIGVLVTLKRAEDQKGEEEKVEVWRMTKTGRREDLRVNSSKDMYYNPDDKEWHKIK